MAGRVNRTLRIPRQRPSLWVQWRILARWFFKKILPLVPYSYSIMSHAGGEARRWNDWWQIWYSVCSGVRNDWWQIWYSVCSGVQVPWEVMMIAFITIKKWFSTLDWGCMRSNLIFKIWDYQWFALTCFAFFGRKKKYVEEKKQLVQDLILPFSIYIKVCTLYTYTKTCMPRFSPSEFFGSSRCLIPTPGLIPEYPICAVCVCVCVYTHLHPHIPPPALKIGKTQTTPLSLLLSKIVPHAKQQVPSYTSLTPLSSFPNAEFDFIGFYYWKL